MPSATQTEYSMVSPSARKRRREDDGEVQMPLSSTLEASQNLLSAINNNERIIIPSNRASASLSLTGHPRKAAAALPMSKKFRLAEENPSHEQAQVSQHQHQHQHLRHGNISPATPSQPQPQQSYFSHAHPELASPVRPALTRSNTSALLSPCHICHRKPTKKSDLDSFADCMICGDRTCFICLRACQGWLQASDADESDRATAEAADPSASFTMRDVDDEDTVHHDAHKPAAPQRPQQKQRKGEGGGDAEGSWNGHGHRSVICSQCCVERGSEGDVVCLGCLAGMRGA
ncbi:hypothetical protein F5Y14DRAFT_414993 [Nemania sp. NC0429]|nr:hypothetical protein F5Y14DRAFT_414993 [Nemania sp. NC0429]